MKEFFFIALMSVAMLSFGQSVKVEGFVKDSLTLLPMIEGSTS